MSEPKKRRKSSIQTKGTNLHIQTNLALHRKDSKSAVEFQVKEAENVKEIKSAIELKSQKEFKILKEILNESPEPKLNDEINHVPEVGTDKEVSRALKEEEKGSSTFRIVLNDESDEMMILLTGLKNLFQKQLPKMPKEYIARLVYDRNHVSIAVVRAPFTVLGGITYRPFVQRNFAEIVFCAIASTEQVQGLYFRD